jgi:hypothetical protein
VALKLHVCLPEQAVGWLPLRFGIGSRRKPTEFSCSWGGYVCVCLFVCVDCMCYLSCLPTTSKALKKDSLLIQLTLTRSLGTRRHILCWLSGLERAPGSITYMYMYSTWHEGGVSTTSMYSHKCQWNLIPLILIVLDTQHFIMQCNSSYADSLWIIGMCTHLNSCACWRMPYNRITSYRIHALHFFPLC